MSIGLYTSYERSLGTLTAGAQRTSCWLMPNLGKMYVYLMFLHGLYLYCSYRLLKTSFASSGKRNPAWTSGASSPNLNWVRKSGCTSVSSVIFSRCVQYCYSFIFTDGILGRMLTTRNMPFWLPPDPLFTMHCLRWKSFMQCGRRLHRNHFTCPSSQHSRLAWRKSMNIISAQAHWMCILLPWVSNGCLPFNFNWPFL